MANDLMIPSRADVPAYVLSAEAARVANEEAAAGISTGYPARVKLSAGKFILVDGNGAETPYPASKLVIGPDENQYLPVVVLRAKKSFSKVWFAGAYNPAEETRAPDCFSEDGERPSSLALVPQCATCAMCPHNAFGSGKDQAGNATKGKACSDNKILAVFVPGFGIHSFKIPPGSLKNFGLYVKQLSAAGIPLGTVKTLVGFDPTLSTSILIFKFGGYLPENTMPKLAEMSLSLEVEEIISGLAGAGTPAPALPAETTAQPHKEKPAALTDEEQALADDLGITVSADDIEEAKKAMAAEEEAEVKKRNEAAARKRAEAATRKKVADAAKAAASKSQTEVDFDMEMNGKSSESSARGNISDEQLARDLGL